MDASLNSIVPEMLLDDVSVGDEGLAVIQLTHFLGWNRLNRRIDHWQ